MQTSYAPSSTSLTFKEVRTLALASLGGALSPGALYCGGDRVGDCGYSFGDDNAIFEPGHIRSSQAPCMATMSFPNHECCPGRRDCMSVAKGAVEELFGK